MASRGKLVIPCISGLLTLLLLYFAVWSAGLPEDFPPVPALPEKNRVLRELIVRADEEARAHPASAEAVGRLGMIYQANFYFDQARSAYRIAARLRPSEPRWYYCRALLEEAAEQQSAMVGLLEKTLELQPDHRLARQELAEAFFKRGEIEQARSLYEEILRANSSFLPAQVSLARMASLEENWPLVIEYLEPAAAEHLQVRPLHQMLAQAYEESGRAKEASARRKFLRRGDLVDSIPREDRFRAEIDSLCNLSTPLLHRARLAERAGDFAQMLPLSRRAVEADPDDVEALHFLSRALVLVDGRELRTVEEAITLRDRALARQPENLNPLLALSGALIARDRLVEAENTLDFLLSREPGSAEGHNNLGVVRARQGRFQEAIAEYRRALEINPGSAETWNNLGRVFSDQGKWDEAVQCYGRALEIDPNYADGHFGLGVALATRGDLRKAAKHFFEALEIRPQWPAPHNKLGIVLAALKRSDEALYHFREAARIDPQNVEAQENLGIFWAQREQFDQAIAHFREALRIQPENRRVQQMLELALRH